MHTLNACPLLRRALFADGLLGLATSAQAQTTPAAYKYAATVSVAVPGSTLSVNA